MNSDINEQYLTTVFHNFSNETQRLLNDVKNEQDEDKNKKLHKELNLLHNIEVNLLKLKTVRSNVKSVKQKK